MRRYIVVATNIDHTDIERRHYWNAQCNSMILCNGLVQVRAVSSTGETLYWFVNMCVTQSAALCIAQGVLILPCQLPVGRTTLPSHECSRWIDCVCTGSNVILIHGAGTRHGARTASKQRLITKLRRRGWMAKLSSERSTAL